jgi:hypothetical protein
MGAILVGHNAAPRRLFHLSWLLAADLLGIGLINGLNWYSSG